MDLTCPHCRAGRSYLYRKIEHPQVGPALEVIACRRCGKWLQSRQLQRPVERPEKVKRGLDKVMSEAHKAGQREAALARRERETAFSEKCRASHLARAAAHAKPCPVPGCAKTIDETRNGTGLCTDHSRGLKNWENRRAKGMSSRVGPPILKINGHWFRRDAAQVVGAGSPAEGHEAIVPPVPPLRPAATSPTAQGRPRGGQKPCRGRMRPGIESELRQLARKGHGAAGWLLKRLEGR
jgi:hypothetical protein